MGYYTVLFSSRTLGGMRLSQVQLLDVLEALFVDSYRRLFPLEKSHSSDLEPHASPGLSECERRNPKPRLVLPSVTVKKP